MMASAPTRKDPRSRAAEGECSSRRQEAVTKDLKEIQVSPAVSPVVGGSERPFSDYEVSMHYGQCIVHGFDLQCGLWFMRVLEPRPLTGADDRLVFHQGLNCEDCINAQSDHHLEGTDRRAVPPLDQKRDAAPGPTIVVVANRVCKFDQSHAVRKS
jgi:hypothetical protein